jgi:hypothetical protein
MRPTHPILSVLFLLFLSSVTMAREFDARLESRTLQISDHPADTAHTLYVAGRVNTVLRFEQDCDPDRTRLTGWEGRFEPLLVGGRKVVLEPLRDLGVDERIPLLVTLADGTEIPFVLSPPSREKWGWTDHQVNVFKNRESYDAVLSALYAALKRERKLSEENERLKKEETCWITPSFESRSIRHAQDPSAPARLCRTPSYVLRLYHDQWRGDVAPGWNPGSAGVPGGIQARDALSGVACRGLCMGGTRCEPDQVKAYHAL